MRKSNHIQSYSFIIVLAIIILNGFIFYFTYCRSEIIFSDNPINSGYMANRSVIKCASDVISGLSADNKEALNVVTAKADKQEELKSEKVISANIDSAGVFFTNDDYSKLSESELNIKLDTYNALKSKLEYLSGYDNYVHNVIDRATQLSELSINTEPDQWAYRNIIKTRTDFYGLKNIKVSPMINEGVLVLVKNKITDILALFIVILSVGMTYIRNKATATETFQRKRLILLPGIFISVFAVTAMYFTNFLLTSKYYYLTSLSNSIQSISSFKNCTAVISVGAFLLICLLIKLSIVVIGYLIMMSLISSSKRKYIRAIILGIMLGAELLFYFSSSTDRTMILLKEINIISAFTPENYFMYYLNLDIAGYPISRLTIFSIFIVAIFIISFATAYKSVNNYYNIQINSAQENYFNEINSRYAETRRIWHDINNHMLAMSMLLDSGDTQSAKKYFSEVSEQINDIILPVKTGSNVIDALLFRKINIAKENNISIEFNVNASPTSYAISDFDLCSIFGNIIDNAIEATSKLEESQRKITVSVKKQHDIIYISCENPYHNTIRKKGDTVLTTKADYKNHGLGLQQVRRIASKYGGSVRVSTENNVFLVEILLNTIK